MHYTTLYVFTLIISHALYVKHYMSLHSTCFIEYMYLHLTYALHYTPYVSTLEFSCTPSLKQGDQGDYYYILDSGTADVFIQKGNDPELKVNHYTAGGAFGELALLHGERARERDSFYYIIV